MKYIDKIQALIPIDAVSHEHHLMLLLSGSINHFMSRSGSFDSLLESLMKTRSTGPSLFPVMASWFNHELFPDSVSGFEVS